MDPSTYPHNFSSAIEVLALTPHVCQRNKSYPDRPYAVDVRGLLSLVVIGGRHLRLVFGQPGAQRDILIRLAVRIVV